MKNIVSTVFVSAICLVSCMNDKAITIDRLPQDAQDFVTSHFADRQIARIEKDWPEFKVKFVDGCKLEFDSKGNWTKVDCSKVVMRALTADKATSAPASSDAAAIQTAAAAQDAAAVPESVVALLPAGVAQYLARYYPGEDVMEVKLERRAIKIGQGKIEVKVCSGTKKNGERRSIELEFTEDGKFLQID